MHFKDKLTMKTTKQVPEFVALFDADDRHSKRSQGGHWFEKGICQRCGLTLADFKKRS